MANLEGDPASGPLTVAFDRRLKLELHGSKVTADGGLPAGRDLDEAMGLTALAGTRLRAAHTGNNGVHHLVARPAQAVHGRLARSGHVNGAERPCREPAMHGHLDTAGLAVGEAIRRRYSGPIRRAKPQTGFVTKPKYVSLGLKRRLNRGIADKADSTLRVVWEMSGEASSSASGARFIGM